MSEMLIILFLAALGIFLARYVIRAEGVEYLSMIVSAMAMFSSLLDESLTDMERLFIFLPTLFMMMISALSLTSGKKKRW